MQRVWDTMWWAASIATFFTMGSGIPNGISIEEGIQVQPGGKPCHLRGGRPSGAVRLPTGGTHP